MVEKECRFGLVWFLFCFVVVVVVLFFWGGCLSVCLFVLQMYNILQEQALAVDFIVIS